MKSRKSAIRVRSSAFQRYVRFSFVHSRQNLSSASPRPLEDKAGLGGHSVWEESTDKNGAEIKEAWTSYQNWKVCCF
jgi:hypothetical protein